MRYTVTFTKLTSIEPFTSETLREQFGPEAVLVEAETIFGGEGGLALRLTLDNVDEQIVYETTKTMLDQLQAQGINLS